MRTFATAVRGDLESLLRQNMLTAYYSKACDSSEMFSNLKISKKPDFMEHLNKYDVIHFDVQWCMMAAGDPENIVSYITEQTI
ncbi:MAG: hypothetical protein ACLTLV_00145 [Dialister invisus]|uniref:hypothetical protein n=1 Tax=Dialister invisus TaxID=218538 RepID=UPI0039950E88